MTTSTPAAASSSRKAACSSAIRSGSGCACQPKASQAAAVSAEGARTSTRRSVPVMSAQPYGRSSLSEEAY
jgi:hypothetical protein